MKLHHKISLQHTYCPNQIKSNQIRSVYSNQWAYRISVFPIWCRISFHSSLLLRGQEFKFNSGSLGLWFNFIASVSFLFTLLARAPLHKKRKCWSLRLNLTCLSFRQESEQIISYLPASYVASNRPANKEVGVKLRRHLKISARWPQMG